MTYKAHDAIIMDRLTLPVAREENWERIQSFVEYSLRNNRFVYRCPKCRRMNNWGIKHIGDRIAICFGTSNKLVEKEEDLLLLNYNESIDQYQVAQRRMEKLKEKMRADARILRERDQKEKPDAQA
jgi:hypothetical protein